MLQKDLQRLRQARELVNDAEAMLREATQALDGSNCTKERNDASILADRLRGFYFALESRVADVHAQMDAVEKKLTKSTKSNAFSAIGS